MNLALFLAGAFVAFSVLVIFCAAMARRDVRRYEAQKMDIQPLKPWPKR